MALIPYRTHVPTDERPFANVAIIAATVALSVYAFVNQDAQDALVGIEPGPPGPVPVLVDVGGHVAAPPPPRLVRPAVSAVTSAFAHANLIHLAGNMLFLWVFGNAVNYKFRQAGYLGLYFLVAWVAGMAHYLLAGSPLMGASGAINGVMAAFLVFFPRNEVSCVWLFGFVGSSFTVSSGWIILYWLAWDIGYLLLGSPGAVAYWAHVGGFLAGFAVAMLCALLGVLRSEEDEESLLSVLRIGR